MISTLHPSLATIGFTFGGPGGTSGPGPGGGVVGVCGEGAEGEVVAEVEFGEELGVVEPTAVYGGAVNGVLADAAQGHEHVAAEACADGR